MDLVTKVELSIACKGLKNLDVLSKSDPQVVMYMRENSNTAWYEVGRTEMINDNLNPKFTRSIVVDYRFESKNYLQPSDIISSQSVCKICRC